MQGPGNAASVNGAPESNQTSTLPPFQLPIRPADMSSPAPLLRPPIPGARSGGARTPRLGLSIPPSPNARPVTNGTSNPDVPTLARPPPPSLRLATPMGSNTTPQEQTRPRRALPPLKIGTTGGDSSDNSAHSRSGSFGDSQQNGSGSANSSYSHLGYPGPLRTQGGDPLSAISAGGSETGKDLKDPANLPDLDKLAEEKGRPLDVDDLDDLGWRAASTKNMIEEIGSLGEGAGGAVTRCTLKGGKTVFALKVCVLQSTFQDNS